MLKCVLFLYMGFSDTVSLTVFYSGPVGTMAFYRTGYKKRLFIFTFWYKDKTLSFIVCTLTTTLLHLSIYLDLLVLFYADEHLPACMHVLHVCT